MDYGQSGSQMIPPPVVTNIRTKQAFKNIKSGYYLGIPELSPSTCKEFRTHRNNFDNRFYFVNNKKWYCVDEYGRKQQKVASIPLMTYFHCPTLNGARVPKEMSHRSLAEFLGDFAHRAMLSHHIDTETDKKRERLEAKTVEQLLQMVPVSARRIIQKRTYKGNGKEKKEKKINDLVNHLAPKRRPGNYEILKFNGWYKEEGNSNPILLELFEGSWHQVCRSSKCTCQESLTLEELENMEAEEDMPQCNACKLYSSCRLPVKPIHITATINVAAGKIDIQDSSSNAMLRLTAVEEDPEIRTTPIEKRWKQNALIMQKYNLPVFDFMSGKPKLMYRLAGLVRQRSVSVGSFC